MSNEQDIAQKREALIKAYPHSDRWRQKVARMKESQVIAIYLNLQSKGKIR